MALTVAHGADRFPGADLQLLDHGLHLLRRFLGAVRQIANFVSHDGKTTPGFTGARGFNRGVECQQVGLLGNAGDHFENLPDVHGFAVQRFDVGARCAEHARQLIHRHDAAVHHLLAVFGQAAGIAGLARSLSGVTGNFLGGGAELVDCGRDAAGARGLLVGVEHRRVGSGHYAQCHFVDLPGGRGHFADRAVNALDETVERSAEGAEFVIVLDGQAFGQVTFAVGDVGHGAGHDVQRLDQDANQHAEQGDDDGHGDDGRNHSRGAEFAEHRVGFFLVDRQTDVPVDRRQAFDRGEGHDAGFAVDLDFAHGAADGRRVLRVDILERLHRQRFVGMYQDLAVGADQERITHAVEIQLAKAVGDHLQTQVATDHADVLAVLDNAVDNGNHQLAGGQINVRLGQCRTAAALRALVPGTCTRVVAIGHLAVRANDERAILVAEVGAHEGRGHGFLYKQAGNVVGIGVERNSL
ncbi:hypothetical protein D3C84_561040 [compost metagenome]